MNIQDDESKIALLQTLERDQDVQNYYSYVRGKQKAKLLEDIAKELDTPKKK